MSTFSILKPIHKLLPEVASPKVPPTFAQRMMWTVLALGLFFVMFNVVAVGANPDKLGATDFLQVVTASKIGSLITTGIGPIVLASIFLQLFVGAKLIDVNMRDPAQKAEFYGTQKLLAILLALFEGYLFIQFQLTGMGAILPLFGGPGYYVLPFIGAAEGVVDHTDASGHAFIRTALGTKDIGVSNLKAGQVYAPITTILLVLQVALGSIVLLFLDEVVSKHGIGSGISLFIAAGVSLAIIGGTVQLFVGDNGVMAALNEGGSGVIAKAFTALLPLFFTVVVFLGIVYVEGIRIDIPLAFERARGVNVGLPIKLTYVSNIPVILAFALLANMQFMAMALVGQSFCITGTPNLSGDLFNTCSGGIDLVNFIGRATGGSGAPAQFQDGLFYLISPIYRPATNDYSAYFGQIINGKTPWLGIPEWAHVIVYIVFLMGLCVIFGQFWVETTGMGPKEVAEQLDASGLQVPGYRRDPRVVAALLEKYIPPVVVVGSAFVGLLAGLADLTGALGTGTGILLTVGIIYKMYQDIEKQNVLASNSLANTLLGKD